ncbi:fatty acid desaturase [Cyanobium sp. WAJ14-Wanaka]|uniref:fatty acid desaturase n=1 Tax=Cyanobium sp. WAJ14-Wanaka TaxID=2823725 RepID=UPI0020CBA9DC|nr:fatty acid desaturase [Cyanobium sp. WAJ14-Wanaka]MCP9774883.1 fatty acid desaturase [Cyanobium sp. WAJ14-Wanaka]
MSAPSRTGLLLSATILLLWLGSLFGLLSLPLGSLPWQLILVALLGRTLLQTGLFIVGHDAMHRVLVAEQVGLNDRLGALALGLYAALPFADCLLNHRHHHDFQATEVDPDFHGDVKDGVFAWYLAFMARYLNIAQMARLLTGWGLLALYASCFSPMGWINVLLFCTLPLLLSSVQLFVIGTYLPHRGQRAPINRATADSLDLPAWLSLIACFHFGYHREHHDFPGLAWFELPAHRARCRQEGLLRQQGVLRELATA